MTKTANHSTCRSDSEKFERLVRWVRDNGGWVHPHIGITSHSPGNRSIIATQTIPPKSRLFEIPEPLTISARQFDRHTLFQKWLPALNDHPYFNRGQSELHRFKIIALLLYHRSLGTHSTHHPYIDLLPTLHQYDYHPIQCWEKERHAWKLISPKFAADIQTHHTIISQYRSLLLYFNKINSAISPDYLSLDHVTWAFITYISRAWEPFGLIPVADLLQTDKSSKIFIDSKENYRPFADTVDETPKGAEIFDNYGTLDDYALLLYYGFRYPSGPRMIKLTFQPTPDLPLLRKKPDLQSIIIPLQDNKKLCISDTGMMDPLHRYLRLICLSETDLNRLLAGEVNSNSPISIENTLAVYRTLLSILDQLENSYSPEHLHHARSAIDKYPPHTITAQLAHTICTNYAIIQKNRDIVHAEWMALLTKTPARHQEIQTDATDRKQITIDTTPSPGKYSR